LVVVVGGGATGPLPREGGAEELREERNVVIGKRNVLGLLNETSSSPSLLRSLLEVKNMV